MLCRRDGDRVRIFSRHGRDWTERLPSIVEAMLSIRAWSVTIDGEAVVCDARGVTDFDALRAALAVRRGGREAFLYASISWSWMRRISGRAHGASGRCGITSMKRRSLGEVIALMGLPVGCLDEIAPIDHPRFVSMVGLLIARSVKPPPPPPRRVACRALPTQFAYDFKEIPPRSPKKSR
jgi:hypothetical protein